MALRGQNTSMMDEGFRVDVTERTRGYVYFISINSINNALV